MRHDGPLLKAVIMQFLVSSLCLLDVLILCHINRMFLSLSLLSKLIESRLIILSRVERV